MAPTVSVIVPARDAAAHLPALLDALAAQRTRPAEVILVDDRSRDGTVALARASAVVDTVVAAAGAGPGAARNAGAAIATGDVLAFTDADCSPTPGWLEAGLQAIAAGADVVQGAVTPPPGAARGPWDRTIWVTRPHGLFETANLLVRRERFAALGGFEPWLRPLGGKELGEDVWLGWRAVRAGARIAFAPDALVHHAVLPRGPRGFVAERVRLRFFPVMTARIPELREAFLHRRFFLSARTLAFDAALGGVVLAARGRRHLGAALAAPYIRAVALDARHRSPQEAAVLVAADAVGACALLAGSAISRTPVL